MGPGPSHRPGDRSYPKIGNIFPLLGPGPSQRPGDRSNPKKGNIFPSCYLPWALDPLIGQVIDLTQSYGNIFKLKLANFSPLLPSLFPCRFTYCPSLLITKLLFCVVNQRANRILSRNFLLQYNGSHSIILTFHSIFLTNSSVHI